MNKVFVRMRFPLWVCLILFAPYSYANVTNLGTAGDMTFTVSPTEAMRIKADTGKVGIGTNNPYTAVYVIGTVSATRLVGDGSRLQNLNAAGGQFLAVIEDQKGATTDGGTCIAGAWRTRDLNTEVFDPNGVVTISSNTFTTTANMWVEWSSTATAVDESQSRLYNVTDGTIDGVGTISKASDGDGSSQFANSFGGGPVVAGKTYRLEHRCQVSESSNGFGDADQNFGEDNVFSRVRFYTIASGGTGVCASGWSTYSGKCYYASASTATWSNARTACQGMSADLVRIDDASENTFVTNLISANAWMLARDNDVEGEWRWEDNNDLFWLGGSGGSAQNGLYENWQSSEPNGGADCGLIYKNAGWSGFSNGDWDDGSCSIDYRYVCERDL